jgi:hypothetical protein
MKGSGLRSEIESREWAFLPRLEAHVQSRLSGRVQGFQLLSGELGLILRGRARTYYAKQLAQHAVMEATPVPIVANQIEVA